MNNIIHWFKNHKFWAVVVAVVILHVQVSVVRAFYQTSTYDAVGTSSAYDDLLNDLNLPASPVSYCDENLAQQLRLASVMIDSDFSSNSTTSSLLSLQADYLSHGC